MKSILTYLIICLPFLLLAQKNPIKFGKVSDDELKMEACEFYPEAESMILGKTGKIYFRFTKENGFQYQYEVVVRKKIFKISAKEEGNVKIKIYDPVSGSSKEQLMNVSGFTYNLVDGKIVKTKLKNEDEFRTRLNDYWVETSFALADVQEGSVIEYTYSKSSDFLGNLDTWYLQEDIPVAFTELEVTIPEYYYYQVNQEGNVLPIESETDTFQESFSYMTHDRGYVSLNTTVDPSTTKNTFTSTSTRRRFTGRNIPPVIDEPFMNNKENVPAKIKFQLMTVHYPGQPLKQIAGDYEQFNKSLLERETFGRTLNNGNFSKDKIAEIGDVEDLTKAQTLYYWLTENVSWNKIYSITSDNVGRKTFNDKEGKVSDINLTLTAILREAGLEANPVVLSTRGNGILNPVYPNFQDFNYVIAAVRLNDKLYLCDAASDMPFGMLPHRCLNGNGWMVTEDGGNWVDLKTDASRRSSVKSNIKISEDKVLTSVSAEHRDYSAINAYSEYSKMGHDEYEESIAKSFDEWEISPVSMNYSKLQDTVKIDFELSRDCNDPDLIYIQPIKYETILENPFVREERFSPVDFPYSSRNTYIATIDIPENYVAELPKAAIVRLPNGGGKFVYSASLIGNSINVLSDVELIQKDFTPDEYVYLKQFYQMVADKNKEVVVLKKNQ
ncbi:MAG: transglutaminase domain-containing protein [Bacteroidota bacterium]